MIKHFENFSFPGLLAIIGFILVLTGWFEISDITKLSLTRAGEPMYFVAGIGIALLVASPVMFLIDKTASRFRPPFEFNRKPNLIPNSVFLSAPMNSFVVKGQPQDYEKSRSQMLNIMAALKRHCGIEDVYYAGEAIKSPDEFDLPGSSLKDDFRRIQEREYFVLIWSDTFASRSALIEAGIALTLGKKFVCLVTNVKHLPFLLKGAPNVTRNLKIIVYDDDKELLNKLSATRCQMFDFDKTL